MSVPSIVGERFEIVRQAGSGGMGAVYCAHDRQAGGLVALKVLHQEQHADRFLREARLLSALDDEAIVRHIAHGRTAGGGLYIAMEWLEGLDLAERIEESVLSPDETVVLAARVARALAVAHGRGIVHRDIKPSNVFLPAGALDQAKVLDFGVALWRSADHARTRTGAILGTPAYMAPEQARGARDIDPRADVFALGCVMFECLTGQPAFSGEHPMAVLAKILFEAAPRLRAACPDAGVELDAIVTAMLQKDPAARLASGAAVAEALAGIAGVSGTRSRRDRGVASASETEAIGTGERRSVVFVLCAWDVAGGGAHGGTVAEEDAELDGLFRVFEEHGARAELLANGSVAALFDGAPQAEPTDTAALAARCALALRAAAPGALGVALSVGQIETGDREPLGSAIDHAARLLASDAAARAVAIDDMAAGLLDGRFDVRRGAAASELVGERVVSAGMRTLLGKPTPCVGRDRELTTLDGYVDEAIEESRARSVLVTAPAGVGKSRLALELVRRMQARDVADVWVARADPMRAGAPLGLLAPLVRRMMGVGDGEPADVQRRKVQAHVERRIPGPDGGRVSAFLSELVGASAPADALPVEITAARRDPKILGAQLRRALSDWLTAECTRRPLVLLLDDLHWGDTPTVTFLDGALRDLKTKPFVVLAFGRPEVDALFPQLWASSDAQHIRLGTLGKKAGERLVRHVLGQDVAASTLAHVVEVSGGNAFFLEELIRAVAENQSEALPETVLAMTTARLDRLPLASRRILRAASIFGDAFWRGGILTLVGAEGGTEASIDGALDELVRGEVITPRDDARFPGETEYVFRHALVRDAAYAMLTAADRTLGHRLAAEWLERSREDRGAVLAEHFERGDDPARARGWYVRAAMQAIAAGDFRSAIEQADRAVRLQASGPELVEAKLQRATACFALALWAEAREAYGEALAAMGEEVGPIRRAEILLALASASFFDFDSDGMGRHASAALALVAGLDAPGVQAEATACLGVVEQAAGNLEAAVQSLERATTRAAGRYMSGASPLILALFWSGRFDETIAYSRTFMDGARAVGDLSALLLAYPQLGLALASTGQYAEAERTFAEGIALGEKHGSNLVARIVSMSAGLHLDLADLGEAEERARRAFDLALVAKFPPTRVSSTLDLMLIGVRRGELTGIDAQVTDLEKLILEAGSRGWHGWLFATRFALLRAELEVARGRADHALAFADEALSRSRRVRRAKNEVQSLVMRGAALRLRGERAAASACLEEAHAIATRGGDPALVLQVAGALLSLAPSDGLIAATRGVADRIAADLPEPSRARFERSDVVRRLAGAGP